MSVICRKIAAQNSVGAQIASRPSTVGSQPPGTWEVSQTNSPILSRACAAIARCRSLISECQLSPLKCTRATSAGPEKVRACQAGATRAWTWNGRSIGWMFSANGARWSARA